MSVDEQTVQRVPGPKHGPFGAREPKCTDCFCFIRQKEESAKKVEKQARTGADGQPFGKEVDF